MLTIETYDAKGERFCVAARDLPFQPNSPVKLIPGYKYDAAWCGANAKGAPRKVWHLPNLSLPVMLRAFPGVTATEPRLAAELKLAGHINQARTATQARARELAAKLPRDSSPARPDGKPLFAYQREDLLWLLGIGGSGALWSETGTGKTITTLELVEALTRPAPGLRKTLIVCPVTLIGTAWMPDASARFPDMPLLDLRTVKRGEARELAVASAIQRHGRVVALINYESLKSDEAVRRIATGAYVVFDEVSKCKNYRSDTSEVCRELGGQFRGAALLSGTPAPNDEQEYWPLVKVVAPAAGYDPFPGSRTVFQKEFLDVKTFTRRSEPGVEHFAGFTFKQELSARLHERMAPICRWRKKSECLDLPPKMFERVPIELDAASARAYDEMDLMMRTTILARHETREKLEAHAVNVLAQRMKLRQITAGFIPAFPKDWVQGGANEKTLAELSSEKIDWVLEKAESGDRMIVWTQFMFEVARYAKALQKCGVSCRSITGEVDPKDRPAIINGFKAGEFRILIAHPGVMKWGVSFPGVSQATYGSLNYSLEEFSQSQDRIHGVGRGDPTKRSTFYLLCARSKGAPLIDDDCVDILEGKKTALDFVFELDRSRRAAGFVPRDVGQRIDA